MLFFKKIFRKKTLVMFMSFLVLLTSFAVYSGDFAVGDEIDDLEKKIQAQKEELKKYDNEISEYQNDAKKNKELQQAVTKKLIASEQILEQYSAKIASLQSEINKKKQEITDKESEISDKEKKILDTQTEIDESLELFAEKIRALYISGNDDLINVLMGSGDFFSMMLNYKFTTNMTDQNIDFMNQLKDDIDGLEAEKVNLTAEKEVLNEQKLKIESDLEKLNKLSKDERNQNAEYQNDINKYGSLVDAADYEKAVALNKKKATQKQIEEMESMVNKLIEERSRKDVEFEGGEWGWPMPGFYTITSPFGRRDFAPNPNHKGNDVAGRNAAGEWINGKTIVAANDGEVVAVNQHGWGGGYGTYVVVDHGGGYTTFYAHMQSGSAAVSEGQKVKRGDALGRVGSTGLSTGAHLHFEIRKNNVPTEPISYYPNIKFNFAY